MTDGHQTRYRTREIGGWWRWDPDVWNPRTLPAFGLAALAAGGAFPTILFVGNRILDTYAVSYSNEPFASAYAGAILAFLTAFNSRPTNWRTGVLACLASVFVTGIVICTTIATVVLSLVFGLTESIGGALPFATLISGIPGILAMAGAILLLGRRPAAPLRPDSADPPPTA